MSTATPELAKNQELKESWLPMVVIAMGQALMSFNVAALPVSMGGMIESFGVPPTTVGTAIIMYSLGVAGFVMLGAKIGQRYGSKLVFQGVVAIFGVAMVLMTLSPSAFVMLAAQGMAGLAGAALVPTLVVLIANQYRGSQQAAALGWLGSARAIASTLAFLVAGFVGTMLSWRAAFALLIIHAVCILLLSFKLKNVEKNKSVSIDWLGVLLAASAIILLSFGFNNLNRWGIMLARPGAPFDIAGLSPAPFMILIGLVMGQSFLVWTRRVQAAGKTPLLALQVLDSPRERAAVVAMFVIVALEAAINFTVPLYIQVVQGRSSMQTAFAMMPFNLTVFFVAVLVVRLYGRFTPRQIAVGAYVMVTAALIWLSFVVSNDWATPPVIAGLILVGIGQGALVTLLFNVLVTSSPKELAGDVGSLRGTTNNLAASLGTAVMGALVVGLLSANIMRSLDGHPVLDYEIQRQIDLENITFINNDRLVEVMERVGATPEQAQEAFELNAAARLRSLRIAFMVLAGIAVLAIFPSMRLPNYRPGEVPPGAQPDPDLLDGHMDKELEEIAEDVHEVAKGVV